APLDSPLNAPASRRGRGSPLDGGAPRTCSAGRASVYSRLDVMSEGRGLSSELEWGEGGGVPTPQGWRGGGRYAGIRTYGEEPRYDVGLLLSEQPCTVAGIFSRNAVVGAPIKYNRPRVQTGSAQAIVANSGNANTVTGEQGDRDARRMAELAAQQLGI